MCIEYELVKLIGDEISKEQGKRKISFETKRKNQDKWDKMDKELLLQVKVIIKQLQDTGEERIYLKKYLLQEYVKF